MEQRAEESLTAGKRVRRRQQWVALGAISRAAVASVVLSEDASFYQHDGVDTVELEKALGEALRRHELGRGASTLTQQLAKNLWLSTDRSVLRKLKELVLAKRLEHTLTKARILTLYLNVVEWGEGVYGIEAAALEHFGVHASALDAAQGAMLAAMLPAPRKRLPRRKSLALQRHALRIVSRLESVRRLSPEAAQSARVELERFFGRNVAPAPESEVDDAQESEPVVPPGAPSVVEAPAAQMREVAGSPEAEAAGEGDAVPAGVP